MLFLTAVALGLTTLSIIQVVHFLAHGTFNVGVAAYLVLSVICGVLTITWGRVFAFHAGNVFRLVPAASYDVATGAIARPARKL